MAVTNRKISAEIIADSIDPRGHRITTFILTYPRMIHAELLTHRLFSRNAASSRAIPFSKMVEDIENDPFVPIAWQKEHKGMQGTEYVTDPLEIEDLKNAWIDASVSAINSAKLLYDGDGDGLCTKITKQICNRILEPFQWYTVLLTATEFDNFYKLRCPKYTFDSECGIIEFTCRRDAAKWLSVRGMDVPKTEEEWFMCSSSKAEIHIQSLADAMFTAQLESTPNKLNYGDWHIPFNKSMPDVSDENKLKIATARCARVSYLTFDKQSDPEKDYALHDLLKADMHASPFEHCCQVMGNEEYYSFIKGRVPTYTENDGTIFNAEYYPFIGDDNKIFGISFPNEVNPKNGNRFGWCNNVRGFKQLRYIYGMDDDN